MIEAVIFDLDNTLMDFMKMKSMSIDSAINGMIEAGMDIEFNESKDQIYSIYAIVLFNIKTIVRS